MTNLTQPLVLSDLIQRANRLRESDDWESFLPGVDAQWLYNAGNGGPAAALLRHHPGAHVPLHEHVGYEHILILEGEQSDDLGSYPAGTFVINPPGSKHRLYSEEGCLALLIYNKPVRFLETDSATSNGSA